MSATEEGPTVHRLAAFTRDPAGGNPAGVVLTDEPLDPTTMQRIAAEVGYSETAFLSPLPAEGPDAVGVRYFSPKAEVPFCGHATIASGVLLGEIRAPGTYAFHTVGGVVPVEVERVADGMLHATLRSVPPTVEAADEALVADVLSALGWAQEDLDPVYHPAIADAGARHLLLSLCDRDTLSGMDYEFDLMLDLMRSVDLTTVALLWRESAELFHARNLFPPGGVVEDPATGAAAAAFGAYLRAHDHVRPPADIHIVQGVDLGRPSSIAVHIPAGTGGIRVSGSAVRISA